MYEHQPQWFKDAPTDWGIEIFTEAECWVLAYYLHKLGGWQICILGEHRSWYWEHVVVQIGEDAFLDVEGIHTQDELEEQWHQKLVPLEVRTFKTWNTYQAFMDGEFQFSEAQRWARTMAKRLVGKYVQNHALTV